MVRVHVWDTNDRYLGYMRMTEDEAAWEQDKLLRMKYGEYGRTQLDPTERYDELDFDPPKRDEPIVYENEDDDPFNDLYYGRR